MSKRNQYRLINWLRGDWAVAALRLSRWNDINREEVRNQKNVAKVATGVMLDITKTLHAERTAHAEALVKIRREIAEQLVFDNADRMAKLQKALDEAIAELCEALKQADKDFDTLGGASETDWDWEGVRRVALICRDQVRAVLNKYRKEGSHE